MVNAILRIKTATAGPVSYQKDCPDTDVIRWFWRVRQLAPPRERRNDRYLPPRTPTFVFGVLCFLSACFWAVRGSQISLDDWYDTVLK